MKFSQRKWLEVIHIHNNFLNQMTKQSHRRCLDKSVGTLTLFYKHKLIVKSRSPHLDIVQILFIEAFDKVCYLLLGFSILQWQGISISEGLLGQKLIRFLP